MLSCANASPDAPRALMDWYQLDVDTVAGRLRVDPVLGLSRDEASRRLQQYSANELIERGGRRPAARSREVAASAAASALARSRRHLDQVVHGGDARCGGGGVFDRVPLRP